MSDLHTRIESSQSSGESNHPKSSDMLRSITESKEALHLRGGGGSSRSSMRDVWDRATDPEVRELRARDRELRVSLDDLKHIKRQRDAANEDIDKWQTRGNDNDARTVHGQVYEYKMQILSDHARAVVSNNDMNSREGSSRASSAYNEIIENLDNNNAGLGQRIERITRFMGNYGTQHQINEYRSALQRVDAWQQVNLAWHKEGRAKIVEQQKPSIREQYANDKRALSDYKERRGSTSITSSNKEEMRELIEEFETYSNNTMLVWGELRTNLQTARQDYDSPAQLPGYSEQS